MMTDPIADLLTRVRNALRNRATDCVVPGSGLKVRVLDVLQREGYIQGYEAFSEGPKSMLRVSLKYGPDGEQLITTIDRFSKPGCRRYRTVADLPASVEASASPWFPRTRVSSRIVSAASRTWAAR
jgi:small subunit ribosomal protein S8